MKPASKVGLLAIAVGVVLLPFQNHICVRFCGGVNPVIEPVYLLGIFTIFGGILAMALSFFSEDQ